MIKILVWGTGKGYNECVGFLKWLEKIGDITIVGVTSNDNYYSFIDGIKFVKKNEIVEIDYDYIIVVAKSAFDKICSEGILLGIEREKFIPSDVIYLPNFTFDRYTELLKSRLTIISNNCWAGITYHYLQIKFQSPFINMYIEDEEYLRMLGNLREYLAEPLIFCDKEINPIEKFEYPVFLLGDVKLHMNHYHSIEEGEEAWYERRERINWDNLFVMMYTQSKSIAKKFSELEYKKKICFVDFDDNIHSSVIPIKPFQCRTDKSKMLWEYVLDIAGGRLVYYDIWSLLLEGQLKYRID